MAGQGSGYADEQNKNQSAISESMMKILPQLQQLLAMQSKTGTQYEQTRQTAIQQLVNALNPANAAAQDQVAKNAAGANYANASKQAGLQAAAAGGSSAMVTGAQKSMLGQGARAQTAIDQNSINPHTQSSRIGAWVDSLSQAQKMPALSDFQTLASTVYGQPQVQVQPGLGSIIGSVAGGLTSNPGLFKK